MTKPLIKNRNEPAFDADLTRSRDGIAMLVSGHRQGSRTLAVVYVDAAGDPSADHRLADLKSPTQGKGFQVKGSDPFIEKSPNK